MRRFRGAFDQQIGQVGEDIVDQVGPMRLQCDRKLGSDVGSTGLCDGDEAPQVAGIVESALALYQLVCTPPARMQCRESLANANA